MKLITSIAVSLMVVACKENPQQPIRQEPAPAPTPATTSLPSTTDIQPEAPCAFAWMENDPGCNDESKDCIASTTESGRCVIYKKKPTPAEMKRLAATAAAERKARAEKEAAQKRLCSGRNILNTCCPKACSGEQSIQSCLMSFYRRGCESVEGMYITCPCLEEE